MPVVLYHGAEPWSAPVTFDDLSEIPDERLRARAMTALGRLVEVCFKHARERADLLEILHSWADVLREVVRAPNGLEALVLVMRYILLVNDHVEPEALQAFLERVQLSSPRLRIDVVLPAVLVVTGGICWARSASKSAITASTAITIIGLVQLVLAIRVFR